MSYCYPQEEDEGKRYRRTIIFYRRDLLYDLGNLGYVEADLMEGDDTHFPHQTADITEDGNVDRVTRVLDAAFSEAQEALRLLTRRFVDQCGTEDTTLPFYSDDEEKEACYTLTLRVGSRFSDTTVEYIKQQVHEYMVCRVMWDWLSITDRRDKGKGWQIWKEKAEEALERLKKCRNNTGKRTRIRPHPF